MLIHKSHSKKSLYEIIEIFQLEVPDYLDMPKLELQISVWDCIKSLQCIEPDDKYLFVKDLEDLKKYLMRADQRKVLTIKEKDKVMKDAKEIIHYAKCNYSIARSTFDNHDYIYNKVFYIAQFGDLPTIRRAVKLFNEDPKMSKCDIIEPTISQRMQYKLNEDNQLKKYKTEGLIVKNGKFEIVFS